MKITITDNDGLILSALDILDKPRPDIEDLDDDNLYVFEPHAIADEVRDEIERLIRVPSEYHDKLQKDPIQFKLNFVIRGRRIITRR
jgi:hypothetical protein